MKKSGMLKISVALVLAAAMLWAAPTLAQGRGKGQWGQGGQGWGCGQGQGMGQGAGQGAGYGTCPNYPGYQNPQGNSGNNPQGNFGGRGPRGGGRNSQPNPQTNVPPPTQ
jgi:hypothetical protein